MSRAAARMAARTGPILVALDGCVYRLQHVDAYHLARVGYADLEGSRVYQEAVAAAEEQQTEDSARAVGADDDDVEAIKAQRMKVVRERVASQIAAAMSTDAGARALRARMDAYVMASVDAIGFLRPSVSVGEPGELVPLKAEWRPDEHCEDLADDGDPPLYLDPVRIVPDLAGTEADGTVAERVAAMAEHGEVWLGSMSAGSVGKLYKAAETFARGVEVPDLAPFRRSA